MGDTGNIGPGQDVELRRWVGRRAAVIRSISEAAVGTNSRLIRACRGEPLGTPVAAGESQEQGPEGFVPPHNDPTGFPE
ncbi:MAG: hypothetical protein C7B45_14145 [Sulfobacillus acidophilus]|uniref:Uncharacterized protein n=1 Tax=Sulfobacillus acidophilus TaxID=53633 RepID=A0A2T2WEH9_9FIRM|nr:MAG: hypothetical protein C7B45_14145 [Sulfobacillus acidophilus]